MDLNPDSDSYPSTPGEEGEYRRLYLENYNLFTHIRTTLAKSPIGSLLSTFNTSIQNDNRQLSGIEDAFLHGYEGPRNKSNVDNDVCLVSAKTLVSSDRQPRRRSRNFSFSEVKRTFSSINNTIRRARSGSNASVASLPDSQPIDSARKLRSRAHTVSSIAVSTPHSSAAQQTPPLTPDSVSSPSHSFNSSGFPPLVIDRAYRHFKAMMEPEYPRSRDQKTSERIRKGKRPERPIRYDVLVADSSNDLAMPTSTLSDDIANTDEWFCLEYTLELSRSERRASKFGVCAAGEFSKSYQSWAAIHRDRIHPMLEEQEYSRWKRWHIALERHAEIRRIERTLSFLNHSRDMSEIYLDERRLREWMEWQQIECLGETDLQCVRKDLATLAGYRPDPYHPPTKRNLAWILYRSRSSSCLRELLPLQDLL